MYTDDIIINITNRRVSEDINLLDEIHRRKSRSRLE